MKAYIEYTESLGEVVIPKKEMEDVLTIYSPSLQKYTDEQLRAFIRECGGTVEDYETREDLLEFLAWELYERYKEGSIELWNTQVPVVFRKYPEGDVIALFPYTACSLFHNVVCYQHIGQHGRAEYHAVIRATRPAAESEYKPLLDELRGLGYDLRAVKRAKVTYK